MCGVSMVLRIAGVLLVALLTACAELQRAELPPEAALAPSEAPFWQTVTAHETDDWFYLLNEGEEALDWRLRAIDSARVSIDMETFLWKPDSAGYQVLAHLLAAADRGVHVRILTNSLRSNNHLAAHAAYRGHVERLVDHGADLHEVRAQAVDRHRYMRLPVDQKKLGLHAKLLLIDDDVAFIGSANLDPRSLNINTEVGLIIRSRELNAALRERLEIDFHPRNAWAVRRGESGELEWIGHDQVLQHQPSDSAIQRLEDWFIGLLPIDAQM